MADLSVSDIQRALIARGYEIGKVDGDAGPKTIAALRAFQKVAGLVPDGIAGPMTVKALQANDISQRRVADD